LFLKTTLLLEQRVTGTRPRADDFQSKCLVYGL